jgi:D-arabinose 1-dehydrogenase-like Zn-dependent alcohol dehydrogenase
MAAADLPESMKAQFLDAFNTPYNLRSTPLPKPTSKHDLLIKVEAASYCQFVPTSINILTQTLKINTFPSTDAVLSSGQMAPHPPSLPHICSHEFAGTIITAPPSSIYKRGDKGI